MTTIEVIDDDLLHKINEEDFVELDHAHEDTYEGL